MKKILFIGMSPIIGGVDTFILNVFLNLSSKYKFEFLNTSDRSLAYSKLIKQKGGIIRDLPIKSSKFRYLTRFYYAKKFFKKHHDYSLVHLNTPTINKLFWLKAAREYGIPSCIIHSHTYLSDKSKFYKKMAKPLVMYNQRYLKIHKDIIKCAASNQCGRWMFDDDNFIEISNGIYTKSYIHNSNERKMLKKRLGLKASDKVIIITARMAYQKNYNKIINVFDVIHKYDDKIKLVIIGTGEEKNKIKSRIRLLHLNKFIFLLGSKNKQGIAKWLNIGDLMIMPSYHEAVPFSLTEAQAAGIPALVSTGVPREANITGDVTYMSLNQTDKEWAKEALNILSRPYDMGYKLQMNNKVKHSEYNVKNSMKKIKELYSKLLSE